MDKNLFFHIDFTLWNVCRHLEWKHKSSHKDS